MIEPVTTFRDKQGAPLPRWAIRPGMLITDVTYDARSGCMDVAVKEPADAEPGYEPALCPTCGADLNDTRHGDAHQWVGGCPDA